MTRSIVLMGVAGCGKTSVGQALSAALGWPFIDGDDFHSAENVEKMAQGIPLNDEDREPWLKTLNDLIRAQSRVGQPVVLACSALKDSYRQQLRSGKEGLIFVYLRGDFDLIWSRMAGRPDHYMKPHMLESQFETLEVPADALVVDIDQSIEAIVQAVCEGIDDLCRGHLSDLYPDVTEPP